MEWIKGHGRRFRLNGMCPPMKRWTGGRCPNPPFPVVESISRRRWMRGEEEVGSSSRLSSSFLNDSDG